MKTSSMKEPLEFPTFDGFDSDHEDIDLPLCEGNRSSRYTINDIESLEDNEKIDLTLDEQMEIIVLSDDESETEKTT